MRDDDGDAAAGADAGDGARQRLLALGVEVRVRLVQHHQERIAVERAGEGDALPLAGRERQPGVAEPRIVAVGQLQDEVVHAGRLGGGDDGGGIRLGSKREMFCAAVPSNSSMSCGR